MELNFYGASRQVTGSCFLLTVDNLNVLIDCGLAQGTDERTIGNGLPFKAESIDYVLLTHAHIDHSGKLPLLAKEGFKGTVYATSATMELASIMLLDSAHIQESEAEWKSRKNKRSGKDKVEPIYDTNDANQILSAFQSLEYDKIYTLSENVHFRFIDAGHLLGSASIEVWAKENNKTEKIVFSGDIGNFDQPIIKDPEYLESADYVVMESTYGDRLHSEAKVTILERAKMLADIIDRTFARGGNVVIPSFAVGRTQEILYLIRIIMERGYVNYQIPVFVDSPLSVKATNIFSKAVKGDYYDEEAQALVDKGINPISFPSLVTITDVQDSIALNSRKESSVIISSSGMCDAGRIKHHLKHNLYRRESTVVFVGYQAEGTLGRNLVDGTDHVTIFGEQIEVKAEITSLPGLSGHADQKGLINWITAFKQKPKMVFVVHGDKMVAPFFASLLTKQYQLQAFAPSFLDSFTLPLTQNLPKQEVSYVVNETKEKLDSAFGTLEASKRAMEEIIEKMVRESQNIEDYNTKRAKRLANAILRLSSDIEDLRNKWKNDV